MVSGSIIDHCQIDDVDRYYIAAEKVSTLCNKEGSLCPVTGVELFIGAVTNFGNVEKCYPKDGPTGQCFQSCFRGKILLYPWWTKFTVSRHIFWNSYNEIWSQRSLIMTLFNDCSFPIVSSDCSNFLVICSFHINAFMWGLFRSDLIHFACNGVVPLDWSRHRQKGQF